jgi:predicted metal-dependent phosphoesterase TrpH
MSEYVWCHGPSCHTQHTQDRIRGVKGSKVLRTKKIKQFNTQHTNFYNYFCSNGCYNDFAHKYVQQVIAIAPRTEPLETPIENPEKTKHTTSWGHTYYDTKITEKNVDNS